MDEPALLRRCLKATRGRLLARALTDEVAPEVLVLSNQHLADHRAVLAYAKDSGIPTVYIAHAPAAANAKYDDLPVDAAGVRGVAEVSHYRELGARGSNLRAVGNPGIGELRPPDSLTGNPVLALSPWPASTLEQVIRFVSDAGINDVVVAPHPRTRKRDLLTLVPRAWPTNKESTHRLLARGPMGVLQRSSGVAWDALALGIPTIQLQVDDQQANYPLIREPYVKFVTTPVQLREALQSASHPDRQRLQDWAASWCENVGGEAIKASVELVRTAAREGPTNWLLDAWKLA